MISKKANSKFNQALDQEIDAFTRDLGEATKEPLGPSDHLVWIKGLNDLSRMLTRHLPADMDVPQPADLPVLKAQYDTLEDFRGKLG